MLKKNKWLIGSLIFVIFLTHPAIAGKARLKKYKEAKRKRELKIAPTVKPDIENIIYVERGDPNFQVLDLYLPQGFSSLRPVVICVHGGGWGKGGGKEAWEWEAGELAKKGFVALVIEYRVAPQYPYPAAIQDCQAVVRWIRENAPKYNIDPERMGAMGSSAGGHLVALLGTMDTPEKVKYVVDYYGPTDFRYPEAKTRGAVKNFLGDAGGEVYADASPITHVSGDDATFLILHAKGDEVVPIEQSEKFYTALKEKGVAATLIKYGEDVGHGFRKGANVDEPRYSNDPRVKAGKDAWRRTIDFWVRHLKP